MKRKYLSPKTKLASALLALGHIPYDDAKLMTESQFLSLFTWDHGKLYAIEPDDSFWNLTPRLIAEHRAKSKTDTSIVAKSRRIEKQWREFTNTMVTGIKPVKKYKWPKRKFGRKK